MGENISLFLGLKSVFKVSSHRGISDQSHKWQGTWVGLLFYTDHTSIATITVIIRQCKTLWKTPGENVLLWGLEIKTFFSRAGWWGPKLRTFYWSSHQMRPFQWKTTGWACHEDLIKRWGTQPSRRWACKHSTVFKATSAQLVLLVLRSQQVHVGALPSHRLISPPKCRAGQVPGTGGSTAAAEEIIQLGECQHVSCVLLARWTPREAGREHAVHEGRFLLVPGIKSCRGVCTCFWCFGSPTYHNFAAVTSNPVLPYATSNHEEEQSNGS